ncbi:MAG: class I fructose-bisphosphate aldolase [Brooklawnia sp.]
MNQIFAADGRSVTLALDGLGFTFYAAGVDEAARKVPRMALHGLDNVLVTYGQAKNFTKYFNDVGMCLRVDVSTALYDTSVPDTMPAFDVEDALRVGADGIVIMNFPGAENEEATNAFAAMLADQADRWNVPFIIETLPFGYPVTSDESNDPRMIATAARFSEELGADIIKTRYSGTDADRQIAEACTVPVLALGGPKSGHETYFGFVQHVIQAGAAGVAVGRNITMDEKPFAMVAALNAIVHDDATPAQAMKLYNELDS